MAITRSGRPGGFSPLKGLALAAALVALLPLGGVVWAAVGGAGAEIAGRDVARYAATSAVLALLVGALTGIAGSVAAWLVVMHRFPGRDVFAWALALPLAAPAFASQSSNLLETARTLGCGSSEAFRRVALPLARPALAAGMALAVMETLADYGAVQFLSVQTLTTGVVRAWSVYGSTVSAARFALPLLGAAALLLWIERWGRRGRGFESARARFRGLAPSRLGGVKAWAATGFCLLLLTLGLLLPLGWLAARSLDLSPDWARLAVAARNSLMFGAAGAVTTVLLATLLALGAPRLPVTARLASLGYATPGAVMAIGLLAPASLVWNAFPGTVGVAAVGMILVVYAYAARLMAAALEPIEAGLTRIPPCLNQAARTLGQGEIGAAWRIDLPLVRGATLTALLIVFIDVLKELPATLILRPFNVDTLAVLASNYALDERLPQAGWPALLIVTAALPAVAWLSRKITAARPGDAR